MNKNLELSYEQWEQKFKPRQNHITKREEWNGWMFETYGEDDKYIRELAEKEPNRIWTVLTGMETGDQIVQGFHYVDRYIHLVCDVPFEQVIQGAENQPDEFYVLLEGTKEYGLSENETKLIPSFIQEMLSKFEKELKDSDEDDDEIDNNFTILTELLQQYQTGQEKNIECIFVPARQIIDEISHFDTEWSLFIDKTIENVSHLILEMMVETDDRLDLKFKMSALNKKQTTDALKKAFLAGDFDVDEDASTITAALYYVGMIDDFGGYYEKEIEKYVATKKKTAKKKKKK